MSQNERIFVIDGERKRTIFPSLNNVSGIDEKPVEMASSSEPFGQRNESGGLRKVESLDEVCEIARGAAEDVRRLFRLPG